MAGKTKFTDRSADTIKAMQSLAKKGLRQAGKVVKKQALENMNEGQRTTVGKLVTYKATISRSTGQPYAEAGYVSKTSSKQYKQRAKDVKFMPNPSWIEFGTRPHIIIAGVNKKGPTGTRSLSNKTTLFKHRVKHPGSKGRKPVTRAGEQMARDIQYIVLPFLQQIATMSDSDLVREAVSHMEELEE